MIRRRLPILASLLLLVAVPVGAQHEHGSMPAAGGGVPLVKGLGDIHHPVTTRSKEAQRYFDQGLAYCFAFNHDEAVRSFEEAARLDPDCAMAHWGISYACGPNINLPMDADHGKRAYEEVQKALGGKAGPAEHDYIAAMAQRYANPPSGDQHLLDLSYANAMRDLMRKYPKDLDAAVLFAEAMMDLRPWDYWTLEGQMQPGTEEIVSTLERVLKQSPKHVGAIHFYIHAVEASPNPHRADAYAAKLPSLAPAAGHLVHMPTHIYIRTGRYDDVVNLNTRAIQVDRAYLGPERIEKGTDIYRLMYYTHNFHMRWAGYVMTGRRADAFTAARDVAKSVSIDMVRMMPPAEFWSPIVYFTEARFGAWDDILKEPAPPADLRYTNAVWHYARGLASVAKGHLDQAVVERDSLAAIEAATPPDAIIGTDNSTKAVLHVATTTLTGEIAAGQGKMDDAIASVEEAVKSQDGLHYDEPAIWYYPVRHSLGPLLLKAGRAADAEKVYREDLRQNPGNGWSLYGLAQSLKAKGDAAGAAATDKEFRKAWAKADVTLAASAY
jgi:tetratricopeptide (TPR) repeat protein